MEKNNNKALKAHLTYLLKNEYHFGEYTLSDEYLKAKKNAVHQFVRAESVVKDIEDAIGLFNKEKREEIVFYVH